MTSFYLPQFEHEIFWRYLYRIGDFVGPNHGIEQWDMCQCVYNGLNHETREIVESMNNYEFQWLTPEHAWSYFEWLSDDTYNWEMTVQNSSSTLDSTQPCPDHHLSSSDSLRGPIEMSREEFFQIDSLLTEFPCINLTPSTMEDSSYKSIKDVCADTCDYLPIHNPENVQIDMVNVLHNDVYTPTHFDLPLVSFNFPPKSYFNFSFCIDGVIHDCLYVLFFVVTSIYSAIC
ncbi:unnamed protein product [Amaranthus hypochondriacus]